jgi:hypothetical protein
LDYRAAPHSEREQALIRKRDPDEKKRKPSPLGDVVTGFLKQSGLEERVEQAAVIPEWESLVRKIRLQLMR